MLSVEVNRASRSPTIGAQYFQKGDGNPSNRVNWEANCAILDIPPNEVTLMYPAYHWEEKKLACEIIVIHVPCNIVTWANRSSGRFGCLT
jgi:hypothetical protein